MLKKVILWLGFAGQLRENAIFRTSHRNVMEKVIHSEKHETKDIEVTPRCQDKNESFVAENILKEEAESQIASDRVMLSVLDNAPIKDLTPEQIDTMPQEELDKKEVGLFEVLSDNEKNKLQTRKDEYDKAIFYIMTPENIRQSEQTIEDALQAKSILEKELE